MNIFEFSEDIFKILIKHDITFDDLVRLINSWFIFDIQQNNFLDFDNRYEEYDY
jgi:hypothetical protein